MANLMVGDGCLLLVGQYRIFLLVTRNDGLNALFEVLLICNLAAASNRAERCLVDDVRELCTGGTGGSLRYGFQIHIVGHLNLLRMYL